MPPMPPMGPGGRKPGGPHGARLTMEKPKDAKAETDICSSPLSE